ncbi:Crp/Fnr family transcriptional regulator [Acetobacter syzygii]|uniref:Crp/Fnr family transcriptional regulator n=1 Tax=Acetobacter syzygii TaxID=146476 RepID=UPI0039EADB11
MQHVIPHHNPCYSDAIFPIKSRIIGDNTFSVLNTICTNLKKPAKSVIFRQGEHADFLYFIQSGALKLDYQLEDGRNLVLDFLWPDRFFGIAENETYAWSATTLVDVHLKRFKLSSVQALAQEHPSITNLLLQQKMASLMAAKTHITLMSCPTATSKLIGFLLEYKKIPNYFNPSTHVLTLIMSRKDIADYLGMTFETTSRIFKYLETNGYIKKLNHRQIQLNMHKLQLT